MSNQKENATPMPRESSLAAPTASFARKSMLNKPRELSSFQRIRARQEKLIQAKKAKAAQVRAGKADRRLHRSAASPPSESVPTSRIPGAQDSMLSQSPLVGNSPNRKRRRPSSSSDEDDASLPSKAPADLEETDADRPRKSPRLNERNARVGERQHQPSALADRSNVHRELHEREHEREASIERGVSPTLSQDALPAAAGSETAALLLQPLPLPAAARPPMASSSPVVVAAKPAKRRRSSSRKSSRASSSKQSTTTPLPSMVGVRRSPRLSKRVVRLSYDALGAPTADAENAAAAAAAASAEGPAAQQPQQGTPVKPLSLSAISTQPEPAAAARSQPLAPLRPRVAVQQSFADEESEIALNDRLADDELDVASVDSTSSRASGSSSSSTRNVAQQQQQPKNLAVAPEPSRPSLMYPKVQLTLPDLATPRRRSPRRERAAVPSDAASAAASPTPVPEDWSPAAPSSASKDAARAFSPSLDAEAVDPAEVAAELAVAPAAAPVSSTSSSTEPAPSSSPAVFKVPSLPKARGAGSKHSSSAAPRMPPVSSKRTPPAEPSSASAVAGAPVLSTPVGPRLHIRRGRHATPLPPAAAAAAQQQKKHVGATLIPASPAPVKFPPQGGSRVPATPDLSTPAGRTGLAQRAKDSIRRPRAGVRRLDFSSTPAGADSDSNSGNAPMDLDGEPAEAETAAAAAAAAEQVEEPAQPAVPVTLDSVLSAEDRYGLMVSLWSLAQEASQRKSHLGRLLTTALMRLVTRPQQQELESWLPHLEAIGLPLAKFVVEGFRALELLTREIVLAEWHIVVSDTSRHHRQKRGSCVRFCTWDLSTVETYSFSNLGAEHREGVLFRLCEAVRVQQRLVGALGEKGARLMFRSVRHELQRMKKQVKAPTTRTGGIKGASAAAARAAKPLLQPAPISMSDACEPASSAEDYFALEFLINEFLRAKPQPSGAAGSAAASAGSGRGAGKHQRSSSAMMSMMAASPVPKMASARRRRRRSSAFRLPEAPVREEETRWRWLPFWECLGQHMDSLARFYGRSLFSAREMTFLRSPSLAQRARRQHKANIAGEELADAAESPAAAAFSVPDWAEVGSSMQPGGPEIPYSSSEVFIKLEEWELACKRLELPTFDQLGEMAAAERADAVRGVVDQFREQEDTKTLVDFWTTFHGAVWDPKRRGFSKFLAPLAAAGADEQLAAMVGVPPQERPLPKTFADVHARNWATLREFLTKAKTLDMARVDFLQPLRVFVPFLEMFPLPAAFAQQQQHQAY